MYFPPITPYIIPELPFDQLIANYGIRLGWLKAHSCPCTFAGPVIGSADPACQQCQGIGVYWDTPIGPFFGLLTWIHISRTPDEPGFFTDGKVGVTQHGEPTLTIPYTADNVGKVWSQASVYDAYVHIDATTRYNSTLQVGGITAVPYQQNLSIDPQGAVTVYNPQTTTVSPVSGYKVLGASVTLPASYPEGTSYVVEFTASPVYVAYAPSGAAPHVRPFGGNVQNLPRRFRLQSLDMWIRARLPYPGSSSPNTIPTSVI